MRVTSYSSFQTLPDGYASLFEQAARYSFCFTRWWFENLAETILPPNRLCLIAAEHDVPGGRPLALLPCYLRSDSPDLGNSQSLWSLSSYYSMIYAPLVDESVDPDQVLIAMLQALPQQLPGCTSLRFQPLDPASPLFDALLRALDRAGFVAQPFFHLGNWYEPTAGVTSADYLARRPSALRNTIRRKAKVLAKAGARLEILTSGSALQRGIAGYERIYARSWKEAEPQPQVIRALMRSCAAEGALRLALLELNGEPIAAQIWIIWGDKATLYKLTHDQCFDQLSPGTVLTMQMMEHVIDVEGVGEVDFGVGDDSYKSQWMSLRRERWGIVAFDPRSVRGALAMFRHLGGRKVKRLMAKYAPSAANP